MFLTSPPRLDKKNEEEGCGNIYINPDGSTVIQEQHVRRMLYLVIKELANIADDVIIVTSSNNAALFEFLESSLRHKSEMVMYESARALVQLRWTGAKELAPAVSVLQMLCSSHKSALQYAAVRTLNSVATIYPAAVTACNLELEQLITDQNRSIATLAITTLLKTGNENNVERLLKQVLPFMKDISDEFKIVVLESIRGLAEKYPKKYGVLLNFLSGMLRESAGYEFKKALVSVIETIIKSVPEAKSVGLLQLCEFIEDCEHVKLTQRVLYLLGREGPFLKQSRQFTRYIYNRIVLEAAAVKCSATTALARFAAYNDDLAPSILVLLKRIMLDEDDEVRDRAAFYHHLLTSEQPGGRSKLQLILMLLGDEMNVSPSGLERLLRDYTRDPHAALGGPFNLSSAPPVEVETVKKAESKQPIGGESGGKIASSKVELGAGGDKTGRAGEESRFIHYTEKLSAIPQLSKLGPIFKSSQPELLTEEDTEYVVSCVKHVFAHHIVLQFDCTNTLSDQLLEDVYVELEPDDAEFVVTDTIKCPSLLYNCIEPTYALIELPADLDLHSTSFSANLKFRIKDAEADESEVGLADEYQLEDVNLTIADHVLGVAESNFSLAWQNFDPDCEVEETYALPKCKTLQDTVSQIVNLFGLKPCEGSDQVSGDASRKSSHQLFLGGRFRLNSTKLLVSCQLVILDSSSGVNVKVTVRSGSPEVSRLFADALV